ncbi:glycosyltransferase [Devosia sp.]|uniref:glycosyltransferase n=1 Tax=Devosia sp. TaxID=1871048 RepID=UPI003A8FED34
MSREINLSNQDASFIEKLKGSFLVNENFYKNRGYSSDIVIDYFFNPNKNSIKPSFLFNPVYYLNSNSDVSDSGEIAILHYVIFGEVEGRNPSEFVDLDYLKSQIGDLKNDTYLGFFYKNEVVKNISPSPYFDVKYYLERNVDVKDSGISPYEHFITHGVFEGREPKKGLDLSKYLKDYDKENINTHPFLSYIKDSKKDIKNKYSNIKKKYSNAKSASNSIFIELIKPFFNEEEYLNANSDVRNALSNNVFESGWQHFCFYGLSGFIKGKRKIKKSWDFFCIDESKGLDKNHLLSFLEKQNELDETKLNLQAIDNESKYVDVYISCWLRQKEALHEIVRSFARNLMEKGKRVRFVSHSSLLIEDRELSTIECGFSILGSKIYRNEPLVEVPKVLLEELSEVLRVRAREINDESLEKDSAKITRLIKKAYSYWKRCFIKSKPEIVFVWGSTCAMSKLHIFLCKELQINYLVIERGHFPRTICIENNAQFAYGGSQILPQKVDFDINKYNEIKNWIESIKDVAYEHKNITAKIPVKILEAKKNKNKIVLFIGVNDIGSGIAYSHASIPEQHGSLFNYSKDACKEVISAVSVVEPESLIIIKPHPADRFDYKKYSGNNVVVLEDSNINELIKLSDVCVTLSTTAIAQCIVEEKPLVTLAYTDVSGKNISYECNNESSIIHKIRMAMLRECFDEKVIEGKKFIQGLFEDRLYTINSESVHVRDIEEFSNAINSRIEMFFPNRRKELFPAEFGNVLEGCRYRKFNINHSFSPSFDDLDVIVPIYSDADVTEKCIDRVLMQMKKSQDFRLILINDASPDPKIHLLMDKYRDISPNVLVFSNEKNLGFSGTVNKGIEISGERDVILLNSDAFISDDFARNMYCAAYSNPDISTVSVFSNNAGVYSNPLSTGESLELSFVDSYVENKAKIACKNKGFCVEVPVAHGFCLFIKRNLINSIGHFDENKFGRGYSEEIDFSLRARMSGFINVVAPGIFVGHIGGVSFDEVEGNLRIENREIIKRKYKNYFSEMIAFRKNDPLKKYRLI